MRHSVIVVSILASVALLAQPAVAQDPESLPSENTELEFPSEAPAGFVDGIPVGEMEDGELVGSDVPDLEEGDSVDLGPEVQPFGTTMAPMSTPVRRYFGAGAWEAIEQAAASTPRTCSVSDAGLTALITAPVFKESSGATTPATVPAPMTLSRYDEWNGVYSTTSNRSANHTLYYNRNPNTAYKRAFWHPGIGIWQYDSAGVGAPFTAIERMDVRVMAADIARGMVQRYCNPNHSTAEQRRQAAWQPWWTGQPDCPLCQSAFADMMWNGPQFSNITLVPGVSATGGAARRNCTVGGQNVECWYVNPSPSVIEGASWWAEQSPLDGGSPTVAPTPLSAPFYVVKGGGHEERHWLRSDTGYPVDVSARRQLDRNARVRSNQAGSGLAWANSSTLCDTTTGRGACGATAAIPAPMTAINSTSMTVTGTYDPVVFDRNGDGRADVLWHGRGGARDSMWDGLGSARFSIPGARIINDWDDVMPVDINGDGRDDLLFYNRRTGEAAIWVWNVDGSFRSIRMRPGPGRQPLVGDFTGDGRQNVFWYGPGGLPGAYWGWDGQEISVRPRTVQGVYQPLVGDFDGDGIDDIFWYGPGVGRDSYWLHRPGGGIVVGSRAVNGVYDPIVADVDGDGRDDILWVTRTGRSSIWFEFTGRLANQHFNITRDYTVAVADLEGDGRDDVVWYAPGGSGHLWTRWSAGRSRSSVSFSAPPGLQPLAGAFSVGGGDGILWYGPGAAPDAMWWR